MAGGWAKDGAVQERIDASIKDALKSVHRRLPNPCHALNTVLAISCNGPSVITSSTLLSESSLWFARDAGCAAACNRPASPAAPEGVVSGPPASFSVATAACS